MGGCGGAGHGRHTAGRRARRRFVALVALTGVVQAFAVVPILHRWHEGVGHRHEAVYLDPVAHWLRDALLYTPAGAALLLLATVLARRLVRRSAMAADGFGAAMVWAGLGALAYGLASVPAGVVHAVLFAHGHDVMPALVPAGQEGIITVRYSFALLLGVAMAFGLPWAPRGRASVGAPAPQGDPSPHTPEIARSEG